MHALENGGFEIHFTDDRGHWSRSFNAEGAMSGASRPVDSPPVPAPAVHTLVDDESSRVLATERWSPGRDWDVVATVLTADGAKRSFPVDDSAGDQLEPTVAALEDGGFAVAWQQRDLVGDGDVTGEKDSDHWAIYLRRFTADGSAAPAKRLSAPRGVDQIEPALLAWRGGLVIAWREPGRGLLLQMLGDLIFADDFESGLSPWSTAIGAPLTAAFSLSGDFGFTPFTLDVDAAASYDPDGGPTAWTWDFGDGGAGSGEQTTHTYTQPGQFTVTLTITGDGGGQTTATAVVQVVPAEAQQAGAVITVLNELPPGLSSGRAASAVVSARNDLPPGTAAGQASAGVVTVRNDVPPTQSSGRAESSVVGVRNDGSP